MSAPQLEGAAAGEWVPPGPPADWTGTVAEWRRAYLAGFAAAAQPDAEDASRNRLLSHLQQNTDARMAEKLASAEAAVRADERARIRAGQDDYEIPTPEAK